MDSIATPTTRGALPRREDTQRWEYQRTSRIPEETTEMEISEETDDKEKQTPSEMMTTCLNDIFCLDTRYP